MGDLASVAHEFVFTMRDLRKVVPPNREILKGIWLSFLPGAKIGVIGSNGSVTTYVRRRFLPQGQSLPLMMETAVAPGERIDLLSNRVYGDPLAFWRICDANDAIDPLEMLNAAAGDPTRRLRVPLPQS